MIDKSGVTTGLMKTRLELFGDVKAVAFGVNKGDEKITKPLPSRKPYNGEVERRIAVAVDERESLPLATTIERPNPDRKSTGNRPGEKKGKNVQTPMEIPGRNLAEKLAQFDFPSNGKKIFKTFKRPKTETKVELSREVIETVEEKKRRFREQKSTVSTQRKVNSSNINNSNNNNNNNNNIIIIINNNNNNKNNNNKNIAKTVKRASKLLLRASSISDVLNLTEEERRQREWKEKNGNERIPNKMNKMLVKAIKKWRSYQVEPQQMNLGQLNKLKEQQKAQPRQTKKATPGRPVLAGRANIVSIIEGATSTKGSNKKKYPLKKDNKSVNNHINDVNPKAEASTTKKVAVAAPTPALEVPKTRDVMQYPSENPIKKRLENPAPPKPTSLTGQYTAMWDVNLLLPYLSDMPAEGFADLSTKLVTLLMILSGKRANVMSQFKLSLMHLTEKQCCFTFDSKGRGEKPLQFMAYPHDPSLCPVKMLRKYVEHRELLSDDDHLFVTTRNPYNAATQDTLARWAKKTLQVAGIDTGKFQSRSCSLATIVKFATWSNVDTFKEFYEKEIQEVYDLHAPDAIPG